MKVDLSQLPSGIRRCWCTTPKLLFWKERQRIGSFKKYNELSVCPNKLFWINRYRAVTFN